MWVVLLFPSATPPLDFFQTAYDHTVKTQNDSDLFTQQWCGTLRHATRDTAVLSHSILVPPCKWGVHSDVRGSQNNLHQGSYLLFRLLTGAFRILESLSLAREVFADPGI